MNAVVGLRRRDLLQNACIAFWVGVAASWTCLGCRVSSQEAFSTSQSEWTQAHATLSALRATEAQTPYAEQIHVWMREPRTGHVLEGRGAVAVSPHRAMRMILIGPGGTTVLDAWVTRDDWRFEVPPIHVVQRGASANDSHAKGLPIGFMRWWFLAPLQGKLIAGRTSASGENVMVLRSDQTTIFLSEAEVAHQRSIKATRRGEGVVDHLEWASTSPVFSVGGRAVYRQEPSKVAVEVLVESVSEEAPSEDAFVDPDRLRATL